MLSKNQVQESLEVFSRTIFPKEIDDDLVDIFFTIFRDTPVKTYQVACYKCLEELQYFPKPKDIRDRLPKPETHTLEERKRFVCPICNNYVSFMIEGKCEQCHTGVPLSAGRIPIKRRIWPEEEKNYTTQMNMMCQECHAKNVICIKEPADTGIWQCRECYTGLNTEQIKAKFYELQEIMKKDKDGMKREFQKSVVPM